MSRLSELMEELCPDGVEYVPIREKYTRLRGTSITAFKMREIENVDGNIIVFAGGKTAVKAFEHDIPNANVTRVPVVIVQSRGIVDFIYCDEPCTFKNELWAYTCDEKVSVKFLYHVLKNNAEYFRKIASQMGAMPQISLSVTEDFLVPMPPLPVQAEIVRILDKWADAHNGLIALLSREHQLRIKQYEYYRDKLLAFTEGCVWATLGEVARYENTHIDASSVDAENYVGVDNLLPGKAGKKASIYVPHTGKVIAYRKEDILIGNIRPYLRKIWFADIDGGTNGDVLAVNVVNRERIFPKWLYYVLSSEDFFIYATKNSKCGTMPRGDKKAIMRYKFPVPSLSVQAEIVRILDKFSSHTTGLIPLLEAELADRKKQYAYYRDKLLTFTEKQD